MFGLKLILTIAVFCILFASLAYSEPTSEYTMDYNLTQEQHHSWQSIREEWMKRQYWDSLKAHGLELTCSGCSSIYIDLGFQIDADGKIIHHEVLGGTACGTSIEHDLVQKWIQYFLDRVYPKELRTLKIQSRLGTGLSC